MKGISEISSKSVCHPVMDLSPVRKGLRCRGCVSVGGTGTFRKIPFDGNQ